MPADHLVIGYEGGTTGHDALRFGERWALASGDLLIVVTVHPGAAAPGVQRVDAEWVAYEREARVLLGGVSSRVVRHSRVPVVVVPRPPD